MSRKRRRLAGPVGAEVAEDLAVLDDEVDAAQGLGRTEPFGQRPRSG